MVRGGEMQALTSASRGTSGSSIGTDELAEGLMLVRASTLKVIRFQLAMERRDRRVALEAVDDLVELDQRLQQFLADLPGPEEFLLAKGELDAERSALDREKFTLAADVSTRSRLAAMPADAAGLDPALDEAPIEATAQPAAPVPVEEPFEYLHFAEYPPRRSGLRWALAGVLAIALGAGAFVVGYPELVQDGWSTVMGAVQ